MFRIGELIPRKAEGGRPPAKPEMLRVLEVSVL